MFYPGKCCETTAIDPGFNPTPLRIEVKSTILRKRIFTIFSSFDDSMFASPSFHIFRVVMSSSAELRRSPPPAPDETHKTPRRRTESYFHSSPRSLMHSTAHTAQRVLDSAPAAPPGEKPPRLGSRTKRATPREQKEEEERTKDRSLKMESRI